MERLRNLIASLVFVALAVPASMAAAEALVVVEVATPDGETANGTVTLTPRGGEGESYSCTTEDGSCSLPSVPGGMYTATLSQEGEESPDPHTVMIPPSGRVTLHVSTR